MGTKGRDLVLWSFMASFFLSVVSLAVLNKALWAVTMLAAVLLSALIGYYYLWYMPRAVKASRKNGLKALVLMPLSPTAARTLLKLAETAPWIKAPKLNGDWKRAYEVHIDGIEKNKYYETLKADLKLLAKKEKVLYLWETSAPIPSEFRKLFARLSERGQAFWLKKSWPIPRAPGTALSMKKKHIRIGAVIWEGKEIEG